MTGGLAGILGFAPLLTGGGTLPDWTLGLISGVGGADGAPSDIAFGASEVCRNALMRASSAGVVVLTIGVCDLVGESAPVLAGLNGFSGEFKADGRKSTDIVLTLPGE